MTMGEAFGEFIALVVGCGVYFHFSVEHKCKVVAAVSGLHKGLLRCEFLKSELDMGHHMRQFVLAHALKEGQSEKFVI